MSFGDSFRKDRREKTLRIILSRLVAAFARTLAGGPDKGVEIR